MMRARSCSEMDITSVFGTDVPGSSPGGSTKTKEPALRQVLSQGAGRRHVSRVRETAEAGSRNFRVTAREYL